MKLRSYEAAEITSGDKTGSGSSRVAYISFCSISPTANILPDRGGTGFQVKTQLRIVLNKRVIATLPRHSKKETQAPCGLCATHLHCLHQLSPS